MKIEQAFDYAKNHYDPFIDELIDFLRIESVSSDPSRYDKIQEAAQWLASKLTSIGMQEVALMKTALHPIVYGKYGSDITKPTVLIY